MAGKIYYLWLDYLEDQGICHSCAIEILKKRNISVLEGLEYWN